MKVKIYSFRCAGWLAFFGSGQNGYCVVPRFTLSLVSLPKTDLRPKPSQLILKGNKVVFLAGDQATATVARWYVQRGGFLAQKFMQIAEFLFQHQWFYEAHQLSIVIQYWQKLLFNL